MLAGLVTAWLMASSALAQTAECEVMDETDFRGLVLQSQAAIDRGDLELSTEILVEIEERLPCLTFAPPPRVWADYLVSRAIREFASKGDWESPMIAALHLRPTVDRGVASAHPLSRFEAPPPSEGKGTAIPANVEVYVDGLRVEHLPPSEGMHLVQRRDGKWWSTLLLVDEAPPEGWLTTPVEGPPRILVRMHVGAAMGGRYTYNGVRYVGEPGGEPWESDYLRNDNFRPVIAVHARGQATFYSAFGIGGEFAHPADFGNGPQLDARTAAIYSPKRRGYVGAGIGIVAMDLWEGLPNTTNAEEILPVPGEDEDDDSVYVWRIEHLAYPHGTAVLRGPGSKPWDLGLTVGVRANFFHTELDAGIPLPEKKSGVRWRLGLDATHTASRFRQAQAPDNKLTVIETRWGFEISRLVGEH